MSCAPGHVETSVGYTVRSYRDDDEAGVLRLLDLCFNPWPGKQLFVDAAEHLRWKMGSYPDSEDRHVVAESDGEIVGFRLSLAQSVVVRGRELLLHQGMDSAVHPGHRGKGLMARMQDYEIGAIRRTHDICLMGLSMHPAMSALRARRGHHRFANRIETLRRDAPQARVNSAAGVGREYTSFDGRVDALWRAASAQFDFAVVRTASYLNWRYCDRRAGPFVVLVAEQGESMTGYLILCTRGKRGCIADMLVLPGREDILGGLVEDALEHFSDAGVARTECWMAERHPYRDALMASGFVRRNRHSEFGYLPLRVPHEELAVLDGRDAVIHLMAGDVDWI